MVIFLHSLCRVLPFYLSNTYCRFSLGQVENARRHICFTGIQPDPIELQKLQAVEKHLSKCTSARRIGDWKIVLREADAAIASGADASPQVTKSRNLLEC